jgi:hypothetical protein
MGHVSDRVRDRAVALVDVNPTLFDRFEDSEMSNSTSRAASECQARLNPSQMMDECMPSPSSNRT